MDAGHHVWLVHDVLLNSNKSDDESSLVWRSCCCSCWSAPTYLVHSYIAAGVVRARRPESCASPRSTHEATPIYYLQQCHTQSMKPPPPGGCSPQPLGTTAVNFARYLVHSTYLHNCAASKAAVATAQQQQQQLQQHDAKGETRPIVQYQVRDSRWDTILFWLKNLAAYCEVNNEHRLLLLCTLGFRLAASSQSTNA